MSQLDRLTEQALRMAAVGALLHNLGKIHTKFLDKYVNNVSNDYLYQHILGLVAPYVSQLPIDWQKEYAASRLAASNILDGKTVAALRSVSSLPSPLDDRANYAVGDLIEYLGVQEEWYDNKTGKYGIEHVFPGGSRLTHLMNRAHRGASGGEKEDIATAQQPDAADLYLSTPFGYETAAPNIGNINNLLQKIEAVIQKHLTAPADPLPLADVIADLRPLLGQAIADTQRPLNDVTVGDIGHTGMAFLITQAVEWIVSGRTVDHAELAQTEKTNTLFWRVLTVHADSLRYLEETVSLADLRARQKQLQKTFQAISQKLEETLLAVEIYADEQRHLFVFPNLDQNTRIYQIIADVVSTFNLDGLRLISHLSVPVSNHPKDKGDSYIGDVVLKELQKTPPYDFDAHTVGAFWTTFAGGKRTEICTACNVRPQGYGADQIDAYKHNAVYYRNKAEDRSICCICMDRRAGVAQNWAEDEINTTVWLDEVADSNGRLALIVGKWDSEHFAAHHFFPANVTRTFLTVEQVNGALQEGDTTTIRGRNFSWSSIHNAFVGPREAEIPGPYQRQDLFVRPINQQMNFEKIVCLPDGNYEMVVATQIFAPGSAYQINLGNFTAKSASVLVTQDAQARNLVAQRFWSSANGIQFVVQASRRAEVIGDSVQNYSFARLRRIWQTTQSFWETALTDTDGVPLLPQIASRLQIIPQNREQPDLGHYHAYDIKLTDSVKLSVVWDPQRKLFITCDNLNYVRDRLDAPVTDFLQGELTLEEPTGYGGQDKVWGQIAVEQTGAMPDSSYTPAIPILAQPRTFLALVPADKALDVLDAIKTKYEREMGKVRNRLPLHLGVVYFHRRTPLRTALDAGRRMLKYELGRQKDEVWTVQAVARGGREAAPEALRKETKQFDSTVAVTLAQNGRSLTWYVPAVMGDGTTPDNWYPYVFFHRDKDGQVDPRQCAEQRACIFKGLRPTSDGATEECWLIHVSQLKVGDQVYFTPATFDFQWLDSAGQRFAIAYDEQGRRRDSLTRPYLLDDLETLQRVWQLISGQNGLTSSQIYTLRDLIETRRESWQPTSPNWEKECQPPIHDDNGNLTQAAGVFWRFCYDAVANANWKDKASQEQLRQMTDWAVSGLFTDVIQLYMGILKEKPHREENENE